MSAEAEKLKNEIIAAIDAAQDMRALEDVRVAALGKKGSVSALLKTLGGMSNEEATGRTRGRKNTKPKAIVLSPN